MWRRAICRRALIGLGEERRHALEADPSSRDRQPTRSFSQHSATEPGGREEPIAIRRKHVSVSSSAGSSVNRRDGAMGRGSASVTTRDFPFLVFRG